MASHRIEVDGIEYGIDIEGEGDPPVVIVPVAGGYRDEWDATRAALTNSTAMVTYARPGLGSSGPDTGGPRTFAWAAGQLDKLLDAAGGPGPMETRPAERRRARRTGRRPVTPARGQIWQVPLARSTRLFLIIESDAALTSLPHAHGIVCAQIDQSPSCSARATSNTE